MTSTTQVRRYGLFAGIAMSVIGFLIFINLSADDFLSPGFVTKDILLQGTSIGAQESFSTPMLISDMAPVTILVSTSNPPVAFDVQIESQQGTITHIPNLIKSTLTFTPDSTGSYIITIKNLSSKTATINLSDGYLKSYENNQVFLVILSMAMIIGGNYFIVHNYFSSLRNYS